MGSIFLTISKRSALDCFFLFPKFHHLFFGQKSDDFLPWPSVLYDVVAVVTVCFFLLLRGFCSCSLKGIDQFWSCDCIVKETLWNRSEKVDHLAYKYWCVHSGFKIQLPN